MRRALLCGWVVMLTCVILSIDGCNFPAPSVEVDAAPISPMQGPSCHGLAAMCGPSGADSCCNAGSMVIGGTYYRGYDSAGDSLSGTTAYPATVSTFWFDKYEVTVGRFRSFVNAGKGTQSSPPVPGEGAHEKISGSGWNPSWNANLPTNQAALVAAVKCDTATWTDTPSANDARPMNCINWYEAMAFCIWDGGYLPTEAEWNYVATGGSDQRAYPWSTPAAALALTSSHASYSDGANCLGDEMAGCSLTDLVQVGSKPMGNGRWGQSDLAGNVAEWNLDWHTNLYATPCADCAQLSSGTRRVFRGGGYYFDAPNIRANSRSSNTPADRTSYSGVRCARVR